jgi:hypothetical protein
MFKTDVKVVGIAVTLFLCTVAFGYRWYSTNCDIAFDSAEWKMAEDNNDRRRMVHDLMARHKLVGMTKSDIDKLLGVARMDVYRDSFPGYDYIYQIGTDRTFGDEDWWWLGLKFQDNVVEEARII